MMRLRTLGQSTIEIGGSVLTPAAETLFAAALYLAFELRPVRRRDLTRLLWPGSNEHRAQHCLRQALYRLKAMGTVLRSDRTGVMLAPESVVSDVAPILWTPEDADLVELADGIGGRFLPGYSPQFSEAFAEWVEQKRDVVHSGLRRVFSGALVARHRRGEWRAIEPLAERCLAIDPLNEEATRLLAESLAMLGDRPRALRLLDTYLRELGPEAGGSRRPVMHLRGRIAEMYDPEPLPVRQVPLVGRDGEMAELRRALAAAGNGHGRAFHVWGEPGIGKTRLTTEFARAAELERAAQVVRVGCQPHDERRPMSAFVDLVPKLLDKRGAIGCSPETMKYLKRLTAHDPNATTLSPDSREAELLAANIRRAFFDLLDAIAAEARLILVIEDVHWLDPRSWELVWDLAAWVATRRIVVVVTSREGLPALHNTARADQLITGLELAPLRDDASEILVREVARSLSRSEDAAFLAWCTSYGGGNPFHLTELVLHATRDGDSYRAPVSLTTLIAQRFQRLSGVARRVLQTCAILGKLATLERTEHVLGEGRLRLVEALDELTHAGALYLDEGHLLVPHDLLATSAIEALSDSSKTLLSRHAALALEAEGKTDNTPAILWECAEHWERAGERTKAVSVLCECARHALELGLPGEAVRVLNRASALASDPQSRARVNTELITALNLAEYWTDLRDVLEQGQSHSPASLSGATHNSRELMLIESRWRTGYSLTALYSQLSQCIDSPLAPEQHRLQSATIALVIADNLCLSDKADQLFTTAIALPGSPRTRGLKSHLAMVYHCSFGDLDLALDAATDLIRSTRSAHNPAALARVLRVASIALDSAGNTEAAFDSLQESYELATKYELAASANAAASRLTKMYIHLGEFDCANRWNDRAMKWDERSGGKCRLSNMLSHAASLAMWSGDGQKAKVFLDETRKIVAGDAFRHSKQVLALETDFRLKFEDFTPAEHDLDVMLQAHHRACRFIDHDYFAAVLAQALIAAGKAAEAKALVLRFIAQERRERNLPSHELRTLIDRISST